MAQHDDPFHRLQRDVERMLRSLVYHRSLGTHFTEPVWAPPTDLVVSEHEARVIVELAGVPRDRVRVLIQGKLLEISGRRQPPEAQPAGTHYHRAEIWFGDFRRTIELPWLADENKVEAHYRDGMLEIQLVPAGTSQHTQVAVEHQGS
jgi:HSP20 family protein